MNRRTSGRRACLRRIGAGTAAAAAALLGVPRAARAAPLSLLRERGTLKVGVYNDMPPFHVAGQGIDVALGVALAESLGVRLALLPFSADDKMSDDLRNMVWRGHYLGYGPADVLLHVPVDRPLMDDNPRVRIFAPYCREQVMIARRLDRLPQLETMSQLGDQPVAVAGLSLAGWLMLGADGGAYRNQLSTHWKGGAEAARALKRGDVAAAAGLASELESELRGDALFALSPLPSPRAPREGWAVGMAVRRDAEELADALAGTVAELVANGRMAQMFARGNVNWRAA
jgi:ABC-type amino acid transport substrate-binding protein